LISGVSPIASVTPSRMAMGILGPAGEAGEPKGQAAGLQGRRYCNSRVVFCTIAGWVA
jgi:hypothetical protein